MGHPEECKESITVQLLDVIVEERKRILVATCAALVISIAKSVKAVLYMLSKSFIEYLFQKCQGFLTFVRHYVDRV